MEEQAAQSAVRLESKLAGEPGTTFEHSNRPSVIGKLTRIVGNGIGWFGLAGLSRRHTKCFARSSSPNSESFLPCGTPFVLQQMDDGVAPLRLDRSVPMGIRIPGITPDDQ